MTGLPIDLVHAAATVIFLWFASQPMLSKLDRIKVKYGLLETDTVEEEHDIIRQMTSAVCFKGYGGACGNPRPAIKNVAEDIILHYDQVKYT